MTSTRSIAILVVLLLGTTALAGCFGENEGAKTEPVDTNQVSAGTGGTGATPGSGGTAAPTQLKVLAALSSTITSDAPAWVAAGTEVPVSVEVPANAKGAVTYAWAIGPLPGTAEVTDGVIMDTGTGAAMIQPGASKSLTFAKAGVYAMHCHPHPYMLHNVTVIDGYVGPKTVDVFITDGANQNEYRFVPENIVIGADTKVNYKNVGTQPHTSTAMSAQSPPLSILPLAEATGTVEVDGNGWQRIVAVMKDSDGRLGLVEKQIYVTPELPTFEAKTVSFDFTYGAGPLGGTPAEASAKSEPVALAHGGKVTITYAFKDGAAAAGSPENLAQVEVHFAKDGETQDTLTSGPAADGESSGKAIPGAYTLRVIPVQGVEITGTVTIAVEYDLVPPEAVMPAAGADDGHGGHAH